MTPSLRALLRPRGYAAGAILPLALGFALMATAVAVANAYLIRPLPYAAADRVYHVMYAPPGPWEPRGLSGLDWASLADIVEFPLASSAETFFLSDAGPSPPLRGRRVTFGVLAGLGIRPAAGRLLAESDFQKSDQPMALIGYAVWRDRFGSDPAVIGRVLRMETEAGRAERVQVAGVLPPDFYVGGDSTQPVDVIVPFDASPRRYYLVRLRMGVPPALAEQRLTQAARRVATDIPPDWTGVHLESARERYAGRFRPVLIGVAAAASLLLLIVFANVGVLVVLRTARRQKEVALRLALGATTSQVIRLLASETCLLLGIALVSGLLLTHFGLRIIGPLVETELGRPAPGGTATIALDPTVFLIIGVAGVVGAVGLTLVPALLLRQRHLASVLQRAAATITDSVAMQRLRSTMLVAEVAITLLLLAGGGLMLKSAATMLRTDVGFEPAGLARARIALRPVDYTDARAFSLFFQRFTERAAGAGAPVVFSSWPPFVEFPEHAIERDGRPGHVLNAGFVNVGPGYLAMMGIALRRGRDITAGDASSTAPVAVISETLAKRLWPDENALGRQVRQIQVTPRGPEPPGPWQTVVGVAADVRQTYGDSNTSDIYSPWIPDGRFGSFYTRAPTASARTLRNVAAEIDSHAVMNPLRPVEEENRELAGAMFLTSMLAGFAGMAALVAMLGIYGVTAYAVQQREREVAIRMALGAGRAAVVRLFLRENGLVVGAGVMLGAAGGLAVGRVLEHRMFGVQPFDLPILAATAILMAAASMAAAWAPARRASRKDPAVALKEV